eukprot:768653-Hanusia_phi.AAC.1
MAEIASLRQQLQVQPNAPLSLFPSLSLPSLPSPHSLSLLSLPLTLSPSSPFPSLSLPPLPSPHTLSLLSLPLTLSASASRCTCWSALPLPPFPPPFPSSSHLLQELIQAK